ncbi:arsenate reductase/protein-tyrosine-phosphatase family protein [Amnibacterium sp.]|uniref:arsenate reductase/protein-tyrosine-phosphatase family protein n=1 Tax=Amnibacterium sp. TaxID=1872496 RepID=UPI003F7C08C3
MTGSGSGLLLVVCTANVCRSPLAQRTLQRALAGSAFAGVAVSSAGTRALEGEGMCPVSAEDLDPADVASGAEHRARQLTADLVREADLILTMEREQRSAAVQAAPGSQAKVFTLREAEALLGVLAQRGAEPPADLAALARALHSVRGLVPLLPGEPVKRHWWSRPVEPEDPMTIRDGHGLGIEEHRAAAGQVRATADRVGAAMVALAAGSRSS